MATKTINVNLEIKLKVICVLSYTYTDRHGTRRIAADVHHIECSNYKDLQDAFDAMHKTAEDAGGVVELAELTVITKGAQPLVGQYSGNTGQLVDAAG